MAEFSYELISKLKKAKSREEVEALLKADGQDLALTDEVWSKAEELRAQNGQELSLNELEDVAGGRNWLTEGCAATVEPDSDCWGTDGGCMNVNIGYDYLPSHNCPRCGKYSAVDFGWKWECKNCGRVK